MYVYANYQAASMKLITTRMELIAQQTSLMTRH